MRKGFAKTLLLSRVIGLFVLFQHTPVFSALITDVRFWSAPDQTRIVLDLTEPVQYETSSQINPPQLRCELKDTVLFTKKREVNVNDSFLFKITLTPLTGRKVQMVLHQKKPLQAHILTLKPYQDKPHRFVIDLIDPVEEKREQEERQKQREVKLKGWRIVVIDPGHGGEDPGAIGPQGSMEKNIVLKVGEKIVRFLNQDPGTRAFLTRKGDYFIPLEARPKIAREYGADLFVSLHADGSFNPHARGSSIYCLSLSGATDEAAKILADKENMSNLLGGATARPVSLAKDPNLNQILLDLMQNNSMRESFRFAELFLENMKRVNHLKYSHYRQANFVVLRAPDIPSVLVEIAFITNRKDESLLNREEFQEKFAKGLATTIKKYFE